jgi:hypothetical protein
VHTRGLATKFRGCQSVHEPGRQSLGQQQQHAKTRQKLCSALYNQELTRFSASQGHSSSRATASTSRRSAATRGARVAKRTMAKKSRSGELKKRSTVLMVTSGYPPLQRNGRNPRCRTKTFRSLRTLYQHCLGFLLSGLQLPLENFRL